MSVPPYDPQSSEFGPRDGYGPESPDQPVQGPPGLPPGFPGQGGRTAYPKRPRRGWRPWLLGVGAVVTVGIVLVVLFASGAVGGHGSRSTPDAVAATVADSLNSRSATEAAAVSCAGKDATGNAELRQLRQYRVRATVKGKAQVYGERSLATIHLAFAAQGRTLDIDSVLTMRLRDNQWCVPAGGLRPDNRSMRIDGRSPGNFAQSGLPTN
jgi:hypothetical protein